MAPSDTDTPSGDQSQAAAAEGETTPNSTAQSPCLEDTGAENLSHNNAQQDQQEDDAEQKASEADKPSGKAIPGGKAWRQMQADAEVLRFEGITLIKPLMGSSTVSNVYMAEDNVLLTGGKPTKIAVKVMDWSGVLGDYQRSIYPPLIRVYETMPPHPNILKMEKRVVDGQSTYLVSKWCPQGSLGKALSPEGCMARGMAEGQAREFMKQICAGLQFLLQRDLPHGRLTCENVLIDKNFNVRLTDYGYPPSCSSNRTDDDFHLRYRAPELLWGKPFTAFAGDIWSLGIVLYAMLHAKLPYTVGDVVNAVRFTSMPPLELRGSLSFPCELMLKRLLTYHPLFRPTLAAVVADPWMLEKPKSSGTHHPQCYHDHSSGTEGGVVMVKGGQADTGTGAADTAKLFPSVYSSATLPSDYNRIHRARGGSLGEEEAVCPSGFDIVPRPACCDSPVAMAWRQSFSMQLCQGCYKKLVTKEIEAAAQAQEKRLRKGEREKKSSYARPTAWNFHQLKYMGISPRVASMFARYNPCPVTSVQGLAPWRQEIEERRKAQAQRETKKHVANQLFDFLQYSERIRAKFFRFYGGSVPLNCKEFPLPPVLIYSVNAHHR